MLPNPDNVDNLSPDPDKIGLKKFMHHANLKLKAASINVNRKKIEAKSRLQILKEEKKNKKKEF